MHVWSMESGFSEEDKGRNVKMGWLGEITKTSPLPFIEQKIKDFRSFHMPADIDK